jgi:putative SOS response-associated peptidase YedK
MCGRFVQSVDPETYARVFGAEIVVDETVAPSYNVAPTDRVWAIAEHGGRRQLGTFRWGLVPFWADDPKIGARHINARAETVATKPAFRDSLAAKRCIVPADGFYEWQRLAGGKKQPHYIRAIGGEPFAFAGLWASRRDEDTDERLTTCTIITTKPNALLRPIHDRMPAVLPSGAWDRWLDPSFDDGDALEALLGPAPEEGMSAYEVSTFVNSVRNDGPECIAPLEG